jgi:hypothetical protein
MGQGKGVFLTGKELHFVVGDGKLKLRRTYKLLAVRLWTSKAKQSKATWQAVAAD